MSGDLIGNACIVGNSVVRLWGLGGAERLARQLRAAGIADVSIDDDEMPSGHTAVLLLRGDYLFDDRTLRDLAEKRDSAVAITERDGRARIVAAHVSADAFAAAHAVLADVAAEQRIPGVAIHTPEDLSPVYLEKLRKVAPPRLLPIREERAAALERYLFDRAYKGVTDLITKWVWPAPARWMTGVCARLGIGPNLVTATSLVLVVAAMILFARGQFGLGLLLAWIMTFLDTVDGKLARVTVTSSATGHQFDHLLDLFHPPLWYIAWAYGVAHGPQFWSLLPWLVEAIFAGYVSGRLIEAGFKHFVGGFSMFTWRPLDSYFRLIMARRNPNLLLLTLFTLFGLPKEGLIAVAVWTVACSVFLVIRLGQGAFARIRHGRLHPWLADVTAEYGRVPRYARPFSAAGAAFSTE